MAARRPRETRTVNMRLLAWTGVVVLLLSAGVFFLRQHRHRELSVYLSDRADQLAAEGAWSEAVAYQNRYLKVHPDDFAARVKLVDYAEEMTEERGQNQYLIRLLYETIGVAGEEADREELRMRALLAEQLLATRDFGRAQDEADKVLESGDSPHRASALRVAALAGYANVPTVGVGTQMERERLLQQLMPTLMDAVEANPSDVLLAELAAQIYRENPALASSYDQAAEELANTVMDRLVEQTEGADALVARYRYRQQYGLEGADEDLKAALQADPDHYEANLAAGDHAARSGGEARGDEARSRYRAAIQARPGEQTPYLRLAQLLWRDGLQDEAIGVLDEGADALDGASFEIGFLRAEYLVSLGRLDEADEASQALRGEMRELIPNLTAEYVREVRGRLTSQLRLLEARIRAARGEDVAALALYRAAATSPTEGASGGALSTVILQATQERARVLARLGRWDQAAQEYVELANQLARALKAIRGGRELSGHQLTTTAMLAEQYKRARTQAVDALLQAGQSGAAREQIQRLADDAELINPDDPSSTDTPQLLVRKLRIELNAQLDKAPSQRVWGTFLSLLSEARDARPTSQGVFLAELQYALARSEESGSGAAGLAPSETVDELLARGERQFADSKAFWRIAAEAYLRIDRPEEAERATNRYVGLESNPAGRAEAKVTLLVRTGRVDEARAWLARQLQQDAPESERIALRRLMVYLTAQHDGASDALREAQELVEASPEDKQNVVLALEVAVAARAWEAVERLEQTLAAADGVVPIDVDYFRAVRLVNNYDELTERQRAELEDIVDRVSTERPRWVKAAGLAATYAQRVGDESGAIAAYQRAVDLGDRHPRTLEQLSLLLYQSGQFERAQQTIDLLEARRGEMSVGAESLAISTAVKRQDLEAALSLADKSVLENPKDPARRLWLYNVLMASERQEKAESVLAEAREEFPQNELLWKARLRHLLQTKNANAARELLQELPPSLARDEFTRRVALATGHELLGDSAEAREHYEAALRLKPDNADVRLQYANLLMRSDANEAREQYQVLAKVEPPIWQARRQLAVVLAAQGQDAPWDRIESLLEGDAASETTRLHAVLLTRKGRNIEQRAANCERARRMLAGVINNATPAPEDIDRLLMAGVYEQLAMLREDPSMFESARGQIQRVVSGTDPGGRYRLLYLSFLVRSLEALRDIEESEAVRAIFLSDARSRLSDARRELAESEDTAAALRKQGLVGLEVRMLRATGDKEAAVRRVAQYEQQNVATAADDEVKPRLILGLASLYAMLDEHQRAERWYRELTATVPKARVLLAQSLAQQGKSSDAVRLFLEGSPESLPPEDAAALAGVISTAGGGAEAFGRAWPAIEESVRENPENVNLLMSVAILHVTRGDQDKAIDVLRRVVRLQPQHTVALNNLATLLGERPSDRVEALEVIGRAIEVAGRKAALLDTQGTIQLQLGDARGAITSLEESVASVNVDPRYYFHLAAAYLQGGRTEDARWALGQARSRGLDRAVLTEADRELKKELHDALGGERTALMEITAE